jgi:hypothetical protein
MMRVVLNGARMVAFGIVEMWWRMGIAHPYFSSITCCPCIHGIASINLDG